MTQAFVTLNGGSITANSLDVDALGKTQIIAISAAVAGGIGAGTASAAVSKLRTTIESFITGNGTITISGDVNLNAKDSGNSYLSVNSLGVAIGALAISLSAAIALLDSNIHAGMDADANKTIGFSAANLIINANKNKGETSAIATGAGVGAGTIVATVAIALNKDVVMITLDGIQFAASMGNVVATATGASIAKATTVGTSIGAAVSVGANTATATNDTTVKVLADRISGSVKDMTLSANGNTENCLAALATVGGVSAGVGVSTNANSAVAITESETSVILNLADVLTLGGDLSLTSIDKSRSGAYALSIAGGIAGVGVNYVQSTNSSMVEALLQNGTIRANEDSKITIQALFNEDIDTATDMVVDENGEKTDDTVPASTATAAAVGGSGGLVGINMNAIWAKSEAQVRAGLTNTAVEKAGSLKIEAISASRTLAQGIALTVGAASLGLLNTISIAGGTLTAWLNPGTGKTVEVTGDVQVLGKSNTYAKSDLISGAIGAATFNENFAKAKVSHATAVGIGDLSDYENQADKSNHTGTSNENGVTYLKQSEDADNTTTVQENAMDSGAGTVKANLVEVFATAVGIATARSIAATLSGSVSAGVNLAFANNRASVQSFVKGVTIESNDVDVKAYYNDGLNKNAAYATILGTNIGLVGSVGVNMAMVNATSNVIALVEDSTLNVTQDLKVEARDGSKVEAEVYSVSGGALGMGANVVTAINHAKAKAMIENSTITAGNVTVKAESQGSATATTMGASGGLVSASVHKAEATAQAETVAKLSNSILDLTGSLEVIAEQVETNASATSSSLTAGLAGAVGVIQTKADTNGLVEAIVDMTTVTNCASATIQANNRKDYATATVHAANGGLGLSEGVNSATATTNHTTRAAITGGREFRSAGSVKVLATDEDSEAHAQVVGINAAAGVSVGVSIATADANSITEAIVGNLNATHTEDVTVVTGLILEVDSLEIKAHQQSVKANANSQASGGALVGSAQVSTATATTNSTVWAQLNAQQVSDCTDGLSVFAHLEEAEATTKLMAAGVSGLVGANVIATTATAGGTVKTVVAGTALGTKEDSITGNVSIAAKGNGTAIAEGGIASVSLGASFGNVDLDAIVTLAGGVYIHKNVSAYVEKDMAVTSDIQGNASISSEAISLSIAGVGVYLLHPEVSIKSEIILDAGIKEFMVLGNLFILGNGYGDTVAENEVFAATIIGTANESRQDSTVDLDSNISLGGNITANELVAIGNLAAKMYSWLSDMGVGTLSEGYFKQEVNLTKNNVVTVLENANIVTTKDLYLLAENDNQNDQNGQSINYGVERVFATGSGGGLAKENEASAKVKSKSTAIVQVEKAGKLTSKEGNISLLAYGGSVVNMDADYCAGAGFADGTITLEAYIADMAKVYLNGEEVIDGIPSTQLIANKIYLQAITDRIRAHLDNYTQTIAAASNSTANSFLYLAITSEVMVGEYGEGHGVLLEGHESVKIQSRLIKLDADIKAHSRIDGATGKVYAYTKIDGWNEEGYESGLNSKAIVAGKDNIIRTANLEMVADSPTMNKLTSYQEANAEAQAVVTWIVEKVKHVAVEIVEVADGWGWLGWIIKKIVQTVVTWVDEAVKHVLYSEKAYSESGTIQDHIRTELNGKVYLGVSHAKVIIQEDGSVTGVNVRVTSNKVDQTLTIGDILANVTGKLSLQTSGNTADLSTAATEKEKNKGDSSSTNLDISRGIYGNALIIVTNVMEDLEIINHYKAGNVVFGAISTTNASKMAPSIQVGNRYDGNFTYEVTENVPVRSDLVLTNKAETDSSHDFIFSKSIYNQDGQIYINAGGWSLYTKKVETDADAVAIYVGTANIWNADNIGSLDTDATDFRLFLFHRAAFDDKTVEVNGTSYTLKGSPESKAMITVEATGDVALKLTLTQMALDCSEAEIVNITKNLLAAGLTLSSIHTTGTLSLDVTNPRLIVTKANPEAASLAGVNYLALPGNGLYISMAPGGDDQTVKLNDSVSLVVDGDTGTIKVVGTYTVDLGAIPSFKADETTYYQLPNGMCVLLNKDGTIAGFVAGEESYLNLDWKDGNRTFEMGGTTYTIDGNTLTMVMKEKEDVLELLLKKDNDGNWITSAGDVLYQNTGIMVDQAGNKVDLENLTQWGASSALLNTYEKEGITYHVIGVYGQGGSNLEKILVIQQEALTEELEAEEYTIESVSEEINTALEDAYTTGYNGYFASPLTNEDDLLQFIYSIAAPTRFTVKVTKNSWDKEKVTIEYTLTEGKTSLDGNVTITASNWKTAEVDKQTTASEVATYIAGKVSLTPNTTEDDLDNLKACFTKAGTLTFAFGTTKTITIKVPKNATETKNENVSVNNQIVVNEETATPNLVYSATSTYGDGKDNKPILPSAFTFSTRDEKKGWKVTVNNKTAYVYENTTEAGKEYYYLDSQENQATFWYTEGNATWYRFTNDQVSYLAMKKVGDKITLYEMNAGKDKTAQNVEEDEKVPSTGNVLSDTAKKYEFDQVGMTVWYDNSKYYTEITLPDGRKQLVEAKEITTATFLGGTWYGFRVDDVIVVTDEDGEQTGEKAPAILWSIRVVGETLSLYNGYTFANQYAPGIASNGYGVEINKDESSEEITIYDDATSNSKADEKYNYKKDELMLVTSDGLVTGKGLSIKGFEGNKSNGYEAILQIMMGNGLKKDGETITTLTIVDSSFDTNSGWMISENCKVDKDGTVTYLGETTETTFGSNKTFSYKENNSKVVTIENGEITFHDGTEFIGGEVVYQSTNEDGKVDCIVSKLPGLQAYLIIHPLTHEVTLAEVESSFANGTGTVNVSDGRVKLFTLTWENGICKKIETVDGTKYYIDQNGNTVLEGIGSMSGLPGGVNSEFKQLSTGFTEVILDTTPIQQPMQRSAARANTAKTPTKTALSGSTVTLTLDTMMNLVATRYNGTTAAIKGNTVTLYTEANVGENYDKRIVFGALADANEVGLNLSTKNGTNTWLAASDKLLVGNIVANGNVNLEAQNGAESAENSGKIEVNTGEMTYKNIAPGASLGTKDDAIEVSQEDGTLLHIVGLVQDVYLVGINDISSAKKNGNINIDFVDGVTGILNIQTEGNVKLTTGLSKSSLEENSATGNANLTVDTIIGNEVELISKDGGIYQNLEGDGITATSVTLVGMTGIGTQSQAIIIKGTGNVPVLATVGAGKDIYISDQGSNGGLTVNVATGTVSIEDNTAVTASEITDITVNRTFTVTREVADTLTLGAVSIISTDRAIELVGETNDSLVVESLEISSGKGDVTVNRNITSKSDVTVTANDGDVTVNGALTSSEGNVEVSTTTGNVTTEKAITSAGNTTIITTIGTVTAKEAITSVGDIEVKGSGAVEVNNNITSSAGTIVVESTTTGNVKVDGNITSKSDATVKANDGDVTVGGTLTSETGNVEVSTTTGNITVEKAITSAGNTTIETTTGTVTAKEAITSEGNVEVKGSGAIEVKDSLTSTAGAVVVESTTEGDVTVDGDIASKLDTTVKAKDGNVTVGGTLTSETGDVEVKGSGDVEVKGDITSEENIKVETQKGNVEIVGDMVVTTGDIDVLVAEEGNVTITGNVTLGKEDETTTDTDFTVKVGDTNGGKGSIKLDGGKVLNHSGDMTLWTKDGDVAQTDADVSGVIELHTENGNVDTGEIKAGEGLKIYAISYDPENGNVTIGGILVEMEDPDHEENGTTVEIVTSGEILATPKANGEASIIAHTITLGTTGKSIGSKDAPLRIETTGIATDYLGGANEGGVRVFTEGENQGIYLEEVAKGKDLNIYGVLANKDSGYVSITVEDGNLTGHVEDKKQVDDVQIQGKVIEIDVKEGGIGRDTTLTDSDKSYYVNVDGNETAGYINANCPKDIWLREINGDLRVGKIVTPEDVHLQTALKGRDIIDAYAGNTSHINVEAKNIFMKANRNVGSASRWLQIQETGCVDVVSNYGSIWLTEVDGDLHVQQIKTSAQQNQNVNIRVPHGSVIGTLDLIQEQGDRIDAKGRIVQKTVGRTAMEIKEVAIHGYNLDIDAYLSVGDSTNVLGTYAAGVYKIVAGRNAYLYQVLGTMKIDQVIADRHIMLITLNGSIVAGVDRGWQFSDNEHHLLSKDITLLSSKQIGRICEGGKGADVPLTVYLDPGRAEDGLRAIAGGGISILSQRDLPIDFIRADSGAMRRIMYALQTGTCEVSESYMDGNGKAPLQQRFADGETEVTFIPLLNRIYKVTDWTGGTSTVEGDHSLRVYTYGTVMNKRESHGYQGANFIGPQVYLYAEGGMGNAYAPIMTDATEALSLFSVGHAYIHQKYHALNLDRVFCAGHLNLDSDYDITMNGNMVSNIIVDHFLPGTNVAMVHGNAYLTSRYGSVGTAGSPIRLFANNVKFAVAGNANVNFLNSSTLSGMIGGTALLTGNGSLFLNQLKVNGLTEIIVNGNLSGSFVGSDLLLNTGGNVNLETWIDALEARVGGWMILTNHGDLTIGGISDRYNGVWAWSDITITVYGILILLEDVISETGTVTLIADAIYDAEGNRLDLEEVEEELKENTDSKTPAETLTEIPAETEEANNLWMFVVAGLALLLLIGGIFLYRKKKREEESEE